MTSETSINHPADVALTFREYVARGGHLSEAEWRARAGTAAYVRDVALAKADERSSETVEVDREALLAVLDMAAVKMHEPCRHLPRFTGDHYGWTCGDIGDYIADLRWALSDDASRQTS